MLDLERLRSDTPGCQRVAHLSSCGSSLPPQPVVDAVVEYVQAEALQGGYEIAAERAELLDDFYDATASYLGSDPSEVAFTQSAGDAWWRAFSAVPLNAGDRILVTRSEYQANAFGWLQARDRGVQVDVIPNDADGVVDLDAMAEMVDERVRLVSFTMIALGNGAVQPAAEAAQRLRDLDSDAIFLLDACQAAGQLPLDVDELGCDLMVYTGRKFMRGPRGTGTLYARTAVLDRLGPPAFLDGRSATWQSEDSYTLSPGAQRFELYESNFAGKVGLAVAMRYLLQVGIDAIATRIGELAEGLRRDLRDIGGVHVHDRGRQRCGIVTFTVDGVAPADVVASLRSAGINTTAPNRTTSQLDLGARGLDSVVRAGVHYFNTTDELQRLCEHVQSIASTRESS